MKQRLKADAALLLCALIWGASFLVVKDALGNSSVFMFLALRFALAAVAMAAISVAALRESDPGILKAGILLGAIMFTGYALETAGLQFTSASKAAFITGSSVVWVPLIATITRTVIGRRRSGHSANKWIWAGALITFVGLYFLAVPPAGLTRLNRGDLLIGACAVVFALHILAVGKYARRHSARALNTIQAATTALIAAAAIPLLAATHREALRLHFAGSLIAALLFTAVGATALAFALQMWAQRFTTPSHTALVFSLQPVFAAIIGWLAAGERLGGRELFGAALILSSILLAELKGPSLGDVESAATLGESQKEAK
jgi:drug/metabolite transporter (DMT)-like permease